MFVEQAFQLVSLFPNNLAYHLVTLLALQVTIALAAWHRRRSGDPFSDRLTYGATAIFALRILLATLLVLAAPESIAAILPPVERALDMATVALLLWICIPSPENLPRLSNALLLVALLAIGIGFLVARQNWSALAAVIAYENTNQAFLWGTTAIATLGAGIVLLAVIRPVDYFMRQLVLLPLIIGQILQLVQFEPNALANNTAIPPALLDGTVPVWIRLGYLLAFPLLASLAYRHNLTMLLQTSLGQGAISGIVSETVRLTTRVVDSLDEIRVAIGAVGLIAELVPVSFVGVASISSPRERHLSVVTRNADSQAEPNIWQLKLADWPAMEMALRQQSGVTLLPDGIGARQLAELYQELNIQRAGALLIEPLFTPNGEVGFLLIGAPHNTNDWSLEARHLIEEVGNLIAHSLAHAKQQRQVAYTDLKAGIKPAEPTSPPPETANTIAVQSHAVTPNEQVLEAAAVNQMLRQQIDALQEQFASLEQSRNVWQGRAEKAESTQKQLAEELTAAFQNEAQKATMEEEYLSLREEVGALRESLHTAEEALAIASAGDAGISTEWVTRTITHYSSELEEAQAHIQQLENKLQLTEEEGTLEDLSTSLAEETRSPLTSLSGFTNILLSETSGEINTRQRELLLRVQQAGDRIDRLIRDYYQKVSEWQQSDRRIETNMQRIIELTLDAVKDSIADKQLRFDLDIPTELPLIQTDQGSAYKILSQLLNYAIFVSPPRTTVRFVANVVEQNRNGQHGESWPSFVRIAVLDSGPSTEEGHQPYFQLRQSRGTEFERPDLLERGINLEEMYQLVKQFGGRVWVDSEPEHGHMFTILMPVSSDVNAIPISRLPHAP